MNRAPLVATALAVLLVHGCGHEGGWSSAEMSAKVVDAKTGKPVEEAIVVANWELTGFHGSVGQLAIYEVLTDQHGVFRIPAWGPRESPGMTRVEGNQPRMRIFKLGYMPLMFDNKPAPCELGQPACPAPGYDPDYADNTIIFRKQGQTFALAPMEGTAAEQAAAIDLLGSGMGFVRSGSTCYWKSTPRMLVALARIKEQLERSVPGTPLWHVYQLADMGAPECGDAKEFFRGYLQ